MSVKKLFRDHHIAKKILFISIVFVLGIILGTFLDKYYFNKQNISSDFYNIRINDPKYKMISPVLISDLSVQGDTQEFKDIENILKLQTYNSIDIPGMETVSIYYKDLKSGLWAGVGENIGYDPASLMKVPIMIAWLKREQNNPGTLNQELVWTGSLNDNKGLDFYSLHAGQSYTIDNLINLMITKSDNDAKDLLLNNLKTSEINTVFTDVGIEKWGNSPGSTDKISASMYSRFLRILYNASYLGRRLSEKALELLDSTNFDSGLVAGVPTNIVVAHKFGQYTDANPTSPIELHDCGIIYYPNSPYLLCVMTRGATDMSNLESIIKNISTTVYNIVSKK